MPTYNYKCDEGHYFEVFHPMAGPVRTSCEIEGCRSSCARVITAAAQFKFCRAFKVDREYREDLARFKGDKRALVDGPRALKRLMDTTKREVEASGGMIRTVDELAQPTPDPYEEAGEAELLSEAYDEARQDLNEEQ